MPDQDIFDEKNEPNPAETQPNTPQSDPFVDLLSDIKNEEGLPKYKNVEDALKALAHSQQFIKTLQTEKQDIQTQFENAKVELEKMGSIDDFVKRISPNATPEGTEPTSDKNQGLSEEDITKLLENALTQREKAAQADINLKTVIGELTKVHGDKASAVIAQRAKELNTTTDDLRNLAKSNPAMVLSLLSVQVKSPQKPSQPTSSLPIQISDDTELPKWERSAARGGLTNKELVERWKAVGVYTHKKLNVE